MTLSTNLYVLGPVDVPELFRFAQGLLTKYDDRRGPGRPLRQISNDEESWLGGGVRYLHNEIGQGLPAILGIHYRLDGPLATEGQTLTCTDDCDPEDEVLEPGEKRYHHHLTACYADIDLDTTYGYRDSRGWSCGDLHAAMLGDIGRWLDERGIAWSWRNEYTGEVISGAERYNRLVELGRGGREAAEWFRTMALPAIMASTTLDSEAGR